MQLLIKYKTIFIILAILIFFIAVVFAVGLWNFKKQVIYSEGVIYRQARRAENALRNKEPQRATLYANSIQSELRAIATSFSLWKQFIPFIQK